jgi:hypothetical protein
MRFQVPQFIEVEDKIFGPLTFKQFIYVAGGVGIAVVLFTLLPNFLAILLAVPVVVFAAALAFWKVNEKPFIYMVEAFFRFHVGSKLYLWKKEERKPVAGDRTVKPPEQVALPKLSESKLKQLTWELDIKENQNPVTSNQEDDII